MKVMGSMSGPSLPRRSIAAMIAGAALLIASASIHLDLYLTGYRTIPTIGWLFLLQIISAFGLALAVGLTRHRLAAAAGAGFALGTLAGYLLSLKVGLFGFTEVRTTAGIVAAVIDVATFAVLAPLVLGPAAGRRRRPAPTVRGTATVTAAISVLALVLLGLAVATPKAAPAAATGTAGTAGAQLLKARQVGGATILTNARGFTLYSFAPDTTAKSACYGSCAAYWPPVPGNVAPGPGVNGHLGTIKRTDGSTQATYDGHPLYTYVGDSGPGKDSGNNLNLNGGLWLDVPVTAAG
jgi:predicted lipoprotein with Yx(FWY)xxD motif